MDFPWLLNASLGLNASLSFLVHSLQGHDLGRIEVWLALLSISACGLNFSVIRNFLYGL